MATATVAYIKPVILAAFASFGLALGEQFSESAATLVNFTQLGYVNIQSYVDPTYFLTGDYVATYYQTFTG